MAKEKNEGLEKEAPSKQEVKKEFKRIETQEDADAFVKMKYKAPEGVEFAFVTEDCNVFWPSNGTSAQTHAFQQGLKLFKVKM